MYMNLKPNKHKIISFNTTMTFLGFIIVGTPPSPPAPFPTIESLEGVRNVLLERGDKPVKGRG